MQLGLGVRGLTLRFGLALAGALALASCGGSSPPEGGRLAPTPVAVIPATATLYADSPTTFVVTGGSGSYLLVSSDQAVVPVAGAFTGGTFTVVPNAVSADTPVTLTVRDAGGTGTQATVAVTVKPRTVSGTVTITPSSGQSAACGTAVCAGGDAEVVASLAQAGAPLVGRETRFEVVSGDFRIITSSAGGTETLATSFTTPTDSAGKARVRIRALSSTASQTALIQITDVASGSFTRAGFSISPVSGVALSVQPEQLTFMGRDASSCSIGVSAEVVVVGGRPPYSITNSGIFTVTPLAVTSSGGRFTVTSTGFCTPPAGTQVAIIDSVGSTTVLGLSNTLGISSVPDLIVSPTSLELGLECASSVSAIVVGGLGGYFTDTQATASYLKAEIGNQTITISRRVQGPSSALVPRPGLPNPLIVALSDGRDVVNISVTTPEGPTHTCTPPAF
jgi:hypothetical protein